MGGGSAAALVLFAVASSFVVATLTTRPQMLGNTAAYTEHHELFYDPDNRSYPFAWGPGNANTTTLAVRVDRNPAVQGWDYIKFVTDAAWFRDSSGDQTATANVTRFRAVGYAEGYLTFDGIFSTYYNNVLPLIPSIEASPCFHGWLSAHLAFMRDMPASRRRNRTEFDSQVELQLHWLEGLADGYRDGLAAAASTASLPVTTPRPTLLNITQLFLVSFQYEVGRVLLSCESGEEKATAAAAAGGRAPWWPYSSPNSHCSALIKVTDDDVLFGHTAWFSYSMMVRQLKSYEGLSVAGINVTMSSYPGSLSSIDDWYVTSAGVAATETTISAWTTTRDRFVRPDSVSEFLRVMAASFLARSAEEWAHIFAFDNSGTYNNQYMILDTKLAIAAAASREKVRSPLRPGTFWVAEQMPGFVDIHDMSDHLNRVGYWSSFNIPFFNETYVGLGYQDYYEAYGDYYSRTRYSRARLFAARQGEVHTLADLAALLRYNNWTHDDESIVPFCAQSGGFTGKQSFNCSAAGLRSACLTLAARCDLSPQAFEFDVYPSMVGQVARGLWGAIDFKVTSAKTVKGGAVRVGWVLNGPSSSGGLEPFSWGAFEAANVNNSVMAAATPHRQQPDRFEYDPIMFCEGATSC